jgi:ABC-type branched-subunit amino acid transport system substrate-binding protein
MMDRRSNAYAELQVMQAAIEATTSIDDKKLVDYMRANTFQVVVGDIKFGLDANGRGRGRSSSIPRY